MTCEISFRYEANSSCGSMSRAWRRPSRTSRSFSKGAASMPKTSPARWKHSRFEAGASLPLRMRAWRKSTQQVGMGEHAAGLLADAEEFGAQVVLHLGAVEGIVDGQRGDDIFTVEEAVLALDIVELDGEAVGGSDQFVLGEE